MESDITRRQVLTSGRGLAGASALSLLPARPGDSGRASDGYMPPSERDADGGSMNVGPFGLLARATIPVGTDLVRTSGYGVAGDGGEASYRYDPAVDTAYVAANPRSATLSRNGRGFRLAVPGEVNSRWFGALGGPAAFAASRLDGGERWRQLPDDTAALQAAMDYGIANAKAVYIPAGGYRTTGPLFIHKWNGTGYDWAQLRLRGDSLGGASAQDRAGTLIVCEHGNSFALGLVMAHDCSVRGVMFIGQNITFPNYSGMNDLANYVVNGCRDGRYSPYAGIAVDPFGRKSVSPYPDKSPGVHPWPGIGDGSIGYPGFADRYLDSTHSCFGLDFDVVAKGFVVSVTLDLCGDGNQCSEINFQRLVADSCKAVFASGQTQSDNVHVWSGGCGSAYWGFTGINYGRGEGQLPKIHGFNFGYVKHLLMCTHVELVDVAGIHAESFQSVGFFGSRSGSSYPVIRLRNCALNATGGRAHGAGAHADAWLVTHYDVTFDHCHIDHDEKVPLRIAKDAQNVITFRDCTFPTNGRTGDPIVMPPHEDQARYVLENCRVVDDFDAPDGTSRVSGRLNVENYDAARTRQFAVAGQVITDVFGDASYTVSRGQQALSLGALPYRANGKGFGTLTLADAAGTLRVGSVLEVYSRGLNLEAWDGTRTRDGYRSKLGKVSAIDGDAVTVDGVPESLASGRYDIWLTWWSRLHVATRGDVTAGSRAVANFSAAVGGEGDWRAGDYLQGDGIAPGTYLASVNHAARSAMLSQPARGTYARTRLYDADVRKLAAGTPV